MIKRLRPVVLLALTLSLAGCGGGSSSSPTTTATTPGAGEMTLTAYFVRNGKVAPVDVQVPRTKAVATAALQALIDGPPAGFETDLPQGIDDFYVGLAGGIADVSLHPAPDLSPTAQAQIVYTLTQFPTVQRVKLYAGPLTRADFEEETPIILVESPRPGERVSSPLRVTGTANVFEATLQLRLVQNGRKLYEHFVTATSGTGQRGTFASRIPFTASGPATLEAFEYSAADGSEIHKTTIPVTLAP
jgi:Immunoglobulin-like domain of bacterial spore germination/Sporulation and spore germination